MSSNVRETLIEAGQGGLYPTACREAADEFAELFSKYGNPKHLGLATRLRKIERHFAEAYADDVLARAEFDG